MHTGTHHHILALHTHKRIQVCLYSCVFSFEWMFASLTFSSSILFCTISLNCSACVRWCLVLHHPTFFFLGFFFNESVYIIYILLFKIFWHADFQPAVASGSCACWSVFMESRRVLGRDMMSETKRFTVGSQFHSLREKACQCVSFTLICFDWHQYL